MENKNMADQRSVSKMETYKALAGCYFPPDERLREVVHVLETHAPALLPELESTVREMAASLPAHDGGWRPLQLDHARLFVGPFEVLAPAHGSVYFNRDKLLQDQSTEDVAHRYQQAGLTVGDELLGPPDHVTAELEFMYFLLFNELAGGDDGQGEQWRMMRKDFFCKHLGVWGPIFADRVRQGAQESFYLLLGEVTGVVLALEARESGGTH
jgi:putative dimethyl sulfoxide reductase chaperone